MSKSLIWGVWTRFFVGHSMRLFVCTFSSIILHTVMQLYGWVSNWWDGGKSCRSKWLSTVRDVCFPVTESCEWQRVFAYTTQKRFKVEKQTSYSFTMVFRSTASRPMMRSPGSVTLNIDSESQTNKLSVEATHNSHLKRAKNALECTALSRHTITVARDTKLSK